MHAPEYYSFIGCTAAILRASLSLPQQLPSKPYVFNIRPSIEHPDRRQVVTYFEQFHNPKQVSSMQPLFPRLNVVVIQTPALQCLPPFICIVSPIFFQKVSNNTTLVFPLRLRPHRLYRLDHPAKSSPSMHSSKLRLESVLR
jgi:hypothetical protein